jgi:sRNA-binding carbon storage regulator CsrA
VDYISFFIEATVTIADDNGNTTKISMNASVVVQVFREEVQKKQEAPDDGGSKRSIFSTIIKESIKVVQLPRKDFSICSMKNEMKNHSVI